MRYVVALGLALLATPVHAQKADMSTMTCKEFVDSSKETIGLLLMWLHGYFTEEDAPPIIDFDKIKRDGEKLGAYCGANPSHGLITAAESVMD